jgi:hypothetical protein
MTVIDRQRMQVNVGGRDLTDRADSLVFSAVANGGFEIATFGLPAADRPAKGAPVVIRQGLEVAWGGRVVEPTEHAQHGRGTKTVGCEGWQALLKDNPYQMVYVDRELVQWKGPSITRQIALVGAKYLQGTLATAPDTQGGAPGLAVALPSSFGETIKPIVEAFYDAGPGNLIGAVYGVQTATAQPAGWAMIVYSCTDDQANGQIAQSTFTTTPNTFNDTLGGPVRYLLLQNAAAAGPVSTDTPSLAQWTKLAVYGNHGLTRRGEEPGGFYPSDIVRHALGKAKGISSGVIVDSTGYIAPHSVYRTPTTQDVVINDMAKLLGWNWGVWEPPTVLASEPRLDFRPPPTEATAVIAKAECDQLDITSRLGDLYDTCLVTFTDAAGSLGQVTVTLANPQLAEAGIVGRTLVLPGGLSSKAAAETLGLFALSLSQLSSRAAGQATLPRYVRLPGGGSKPACLLRPGNDRLRIGDLSAGGPLLEQGTSRRDVFHVNRVETTVGSDGVPSTRVELDQGTNLLETLQARLALSAGVVGSGATTGG